MIEKILYILILVCFLGLGWFSNDMYYSHKEDNDFKLKYKGMWLSHYSEEERDEYLYNSDSSGQWVCVNVNKDMSYEDMVNTCRHESAHELFARYCADKPEICFEVEEQLKNEK